MQKKILKILYFLLLLLIPVSLFMNRPPESCNLCDNIPMHAPCLINLSTGEIGELTVFDPDPFRIGEIAPQQQGGVFSFLPCAGLVATRITDSWITSVNIPPGTETMRRAHFCRSCRLLLKDYTQESFALVDMYRAGEPVLYPIAENTSYHMRCYRIRISKGEAYCITVLGQPENR